MRVLLAHEHFPPDIRGGGEIFYQTARQLRRRGVDAETFGIALVDAMASGCAVVSSVPLEFTGERITPDDRNALTSAVSRLWSNPVQVKKMGERNVGLARRYVWDSYADALLDFYARAPAGRRVSGQKALATKKARSGVGRGRCSSPATDCR